MGIVRTEELVFDYIRRDEDGNVEDVITAIDNVDINVRKGQFVAILGHNGSGKSTLARHFNALLIPTEELSVWMVWIQQMKTICGKSVRQREWCFRIRIIR